VYYRQGSRPRQKKFWDLNASWWCYVMSCGWWWSMMMMIMIDMMMLCRVNDGQILGHDVE
jgi:hypothetical protein